jgi:UDP-3-O-[3-hydroxymyristoyl] glucosamine N-acyltransferase
MTYTTSQIAQHLGGEVLGDATLGLTGFAPADTAKPGDLTFAENADYLARAETSAASAILVSSKAAPQRKQKTLIRVANARVAFARVLPLFFPEPVVTPGIHPAAWVAASAQVDPTAAIGPHCVVGERVKIGPRSQLHGGNHVGADCVLEQDVQLFPNAVLYPRTIVGARVRLHAGVIIGGDGFGYVFDQGRHMKIPQVGNVVLQEDVEIGANSTVDRATLGSTVIGKGTKIDNLVQVGHNVVLGEHGILCASAGVAGSTRVGSYVTIAGQAGVAGHLKIGNRVTVGGQAGVTKDIPDGGKYLGSPAQPDREMKRIFVAMQRLPELLQRVLALEKRLAELPEPSKSASSR